MRRVLVVGLLLLSVLGRAEEFLTIPTAAKVPYGAVKLDVSTAFDSAFAQAYADYGIGKSFETTLRYDRTGDFRTVGTFDFSYNYLNPISGVLPGLAVGVMDAMNETRRGRQEYIALTSRQTFSTDSGDFDGDITIGVLAGRRTSPFVGVDAPLSSYLRLVACDDGFAITAGIEFRRTKNWGLRFVAVNGHPQIGLNTLTRF